MVHNGMSVLVGKLKPAEYVGKDPIVRSILNSLICYYFDDQSLRFMVQELDLARVLRHCVKELVAATRASGEAGGGRGRAGGVRGARVGGGGGSHEGVEYFVGVTEMRLQV